MKVVINKENFGDIGTAVFYKSHKYIPAEGTDIKEEDLSDFIIDCSSDRVQYRGTKDLLSYGDFSEYDFSYIIEKFKFNDQLKINLLDKDSKNLIGKKLDDLEKIESTMFPTISNQEEEYSEEFFGSGLISNQVFLVLKSFGIDDNGRGDYKIELYEEVIESNNSMYSKFIEWDLLNKLNSPSIISPAITIYLGPDELIKNNTSDKYFSYDPNLINKNKNSLLNILDYRELEEEIYMDKMIFIMITTENKEVEVNLSYKSWVDSKNSNRNMNKYLIRNDEYFSTINNNIIINSIKDSEFLIDSNSGTLLGNLNEKVSCPILEKKLNKISNFKYSPYVRYKMGDKVSFNGKYWESLSNNNYNENPYISNKWAISSTLTDFHTSRVNIVTMPQEGGYTSPSGSITVTNSTRKTIRIFEKLGYVVNEVDTCLFSPGNPLDTSSYTYTINVTPSGEIIKEVTIVNWTKPIESGYIYINLKPSESKCKFNIVSNNVTVEYSNWVEYFSEPNLKFSKILVNNTTILEPSETGEFSFNPGDKVNFIIPELNKYIISEISSKYIVNNLPNLKTITPEILNDGSFLIKDEIDYSETVYTLTIEDKTLTISVENLSGVEVSEVISRVLYGNEYNIKFSELPNNKVSQVRIVNEKDEYVDIDISSNLGEIFNLDGSEIVITDEEEYFNINFNKIISDYKIKFSYDNQ